MDAEAELETFLARYRPEIASLAHALIGRMRARLPGASALIYDNYNALGVGFAPTERASAAILSIVAYPRWVRLFFLKGAGLPDPGSLLEGSGSTVRSILCPGSEILDDPRVEALIAEAVDRASPPFDPAGEGRFIIKSISARQRPRR